jgi:hypothetical protein
MAHAPNFKLALTRAIEPSGGPGVELTTLEDAARFVALLRTWRQARPIERAATLIVFGIAVLSLLGALWPIQYGVFACYGSAFCEVVPGYGDTDSQSCYQMAYLGNRDWEEMGANPTATECHNRTLLLGWDVKGPTTSPAAPRCTPRSRTEPVLSGASPVRSREGRR